MSKIKTDEIEGLSNNELLSVPKELSVGTGAATLNFGNTIFTNASAGSTTITGEGGTTTTNIQQGLTKSWVYHSQDDHVIDDSFNFTSITDTAVGRTGYTIANNMANAVYPTPFSGWDATSFMTTSQGYNKTSTFWNNAHSGGDFSTAVDASEKGETSIGDLA